MEVIYFTNLACQRSFRALYHEPSGHLLVEELDPHHFGPVALWDGPKSEADLGYFGCYDLTLLSNVAAGMVAVGRAVFYALNY